MTLFTEKDKGNLKFHRPKQFLSETAVLRVSYLTSIILPSYFNKNSMAGRRQGQTDCYDFEASLLYIVSSKLHSETLSQKTKKRTIKTTV